MKKFIKSKVARQALVIYLGIVAAMIVVLLTFTGCTDTCQTTTTYISYEPVLESMSALRNDVDILPPQPRALQGKIYIYGDYLLLGDPGKGIHIFNNSDQTNPDAVSFLNIPGNVDMAVRDGRLYADSYVDMVVFDMRDINNITLVNRVENAFPNYNQQFGLWLDTDEVVTSMREVSTEEITTDCSDSGPGMIFWGGVREDMLMVDAGSAPSAVNMAAAPSVGIGGSMARFTIVSDYLYTVDDYMMHIFSLAAPDDPVEVNEVNLGWGIETIYPFKNNLFIGSRTGMFIYNINDPANPLKMSGVQHINTCDPVVANDDYAFVTLRSENSNTWCGDNFTNQLDVIDISDITNAKLLHTYDMLSPYGLGLDGNTLFVTEGNHGLKVFDVTDVAKIDENMIHHITGFNAFDVIPYNGTLILTGNDGLYQFDYTNMDEIKMLSLIEAGGE
ncbi:MAG: hypothetical protein ABFS32_20490 [Bacteroidota bacterium]